ncbi:hypothetical protein HDC93_000483 [Streptomyces sp. AK010]|nr:hypothetical protein [Streptomyces sp. AK010]
MGVEQDFGYPGDGINGLLAAWGRAENEPRFVQARHEEMSAFQAVGYAKFSGRLGVCAATSGPGAIHLLNGLYDAKLDQVPVLAIVGQTHRTAMGGSYQREVDLHTLYKDVASRVRGDGDGAGAAAERAGPGGPHGVCAPLPDRDHHPRRRPGARLRAADARVQDGALQSGPQRVDRRAVRRVGAAGRRDPQIR